MASDRERRPRIGLVTYGRDRDHRFGVPAAYVDAVRAAGGTPLLLPPGEGVLADWLAVIDALVLPGGGDVHPDCYGGRPHPQNYKLDQARDADEIGLARHAVGAGLPTFAICRGLQVLNVAFGGTLIAHLPEVVGERVPHRSPSPQQEPVRHAVEIARGSRLQTLLGGPRAEVASWHHQAIDRLADGFEVVARTADGVVEAIERPGHPFLVAVQWHPELTAATDPAQQRLFDALVAAARKHDSAGRRGR
jgi:putative glutamine amidotransferase